MTLKFSLFTLMFISITVVSGQSLTKVNQAFSSEEIAIMKNANPEELSFLEFKAEHCVIVQDLSGKKDVSDIEDISTMNKYARNANEVQIKGNNFVLEEFNVLLFDLDLKNKKAYYRIGDTGQIMQILSDERCRELYQGRK